MKLDQLNHFQRAIFARCLYKSISLPAWAINKIVEVR